MSRYYPAGRHRVDELIAEHLHRSGADRAEATDALTSLTVGLLRDMLRLVDAAMEDEEIDPATARRILERAIFGAVPLPGHVQARRDMEKQMWVSAADLPDPAVIRRATTGGADV